MHQTLWPEHDFQGATGLMCISLRLKTNLGWHIFFWGKLFYVPTAQLNATVCSFADIISLRRRHNSLGPVRAGDESIILIEVSIREISL